MRGAVAVAITIALALAGGACGSKNQHAHDEEHRGEAHGDHAERHEPDDGLLRIDPEMLRDLRITTARAEARPAGETVTTLGELRVNEDAYAEVSSPVTARVVQVLAGPGEVVKAGQTLVELHSPDLGKARAEHLAAQARAELAQKTLERKRQLAADRIVPPRELQEAEAEAAHAEAAVRAARASLGTFGANDGGGDASRIVLRSPVAGTVIERTAVRGQLTDPARPLFRVGDLSRLWLTVHAFERDAVRLKPNVSAQVTFPALPGQGFTGKVTLIGSEVDTSSRTIPVRIEVANPEGALRPGMSANAMIPLGEAQGEVVTVPVAAVQRVEADWAVFLPRGEGTFEARPVGRGRELGGAVEILTGLKPGEEIVVEGAFLLKAEVDKSHGEGGHEH
jgi:membrane fusion protein, heavy metal efflux system